MRPTKGLVDEALGRLNVGEALVLATVVETWGSSPRPVGSEMFVTQAGEMQGSVSGTAGRLRARPGTSRPVQAGGAAAGGA